MNGKRSTLDVNIATWQPQGILRVEAMNLPVADGVRYVISWQGYGSDPQIPATLAMREDVTVYLCDKSGLAANRNNALRHSTADIVLISDDDLRYTAGQLRSVTDTMDANPEVQLATFAYDGDDRRYPAEPCDLGRKLPKGYSVASVEIAMRRSAGLEFDERFGLGSPLLQAGEDEKLLYDARRRGLRCRFFPIVIATHCGQTTGTRVVTSPGVAAAMGRCIALEYPLTWPLRVPLKAWREWRKGGRLWFMLRHLLRGVMVGG